MVDLKDISKFFDAFYSRFILRDFFGKIIPGSLFLIIASLSIVNVNYAVNFYDYLTNLWIWLIFIGFSWLIGLAIQGIGTIEIKTNMGIGERKNYQLIRIYPKDINYLDGEKKYKLFTKKVIDSQFRIHERYVVLKEACGNGCASILFSLIFILIIYTNILLSPSGTYESIFSFLLKNNSFGVFLSIILSIFLCVGLFKMHRESVINQWRFYE